MNRYFADSNSGYNVLLRKAGTSSRLSNGAKSALVGAGTAAISGVAANLIARKVLKDKGISPRDPRYKKYLRSIILSVMAGTGLIGTGITLGVQRHKDMKAFEDYEAVLKNPSLQSSL